MPRSSEQNGTEQKRLEQKTFWICSQTILFTQPAVRERDADAQRLSRDFLQLALRLYWGWPRTKLLNLFIYLFLQNISTVTLDVE